MSKKKSNTNHSNADPSRARYGPPEAVDFHPLEPLFAGFGV